jgi:hypothetical protein
MAEMSRIVNVSITSTPSAVTQAGFGITLILGAHLKGAARYAVYSTLSALQAVYGSTSEIGKAAAKVFGQSPSPVAVAVGRRQVNTATVVVDVAANSTVYTLTINGTAYSITSDSDATVAEIATALRAAINADSACPVEATGSGANIILTVADAGTAWTLAITGTRMTLNTLVSSDAIGDDLTEVQLENRDWYGLVLCDRDSSSAQAAIDWVAAVPKVLFCQTKETAATDSSLASDTTSLAAILKGEGQDRAFVIFNETGDTDYPDAAAGGRFLPKTPGSYTPMFKELTGITPSNLTETQEGNLLDKYCNVYETIGGANMLQEGRMASGRFLDQVHGQDWLMARIEEAVFGILRSVEKVPYTDAGVAMIENAMKGPLQEAVNNGYLASFTTSVPRVKDVSSENKGNRLLPDVKFTAVEAGAIHGVTINGTISV